MKPLEAKRGHLGVYVTILIAVIAGMFFLRKCSVATGSSDDRRALGDTLNIAIELSPNGIYIFGDTAGGFHHDLIQAVCRISGRELDISPFTTPELALRGLRTGRYDIVLGDIPTTAELKKDYIFSDHVYLDRQNLVRLRHEGDTAAFDISQLAGDTVWLPAGSPFARRIHNLGREIGDTIYVVEDPEYGKEQLVIMTALGEVKQTVVTRELAEKMAADYPQLDISVPISFNQFHSWIFNPADSLLRDSINLWIDSLKRSGEYQRIYNKYF